MIDSLDPHFLGKKSRLTFTSGRSILWNVSSRARKVALTSPEMDRFIGLSLPGTKVCLTSLASDGSTHWTVISLQTNIGLTASDGSTLGPSLPGEGKSADLSSDGSCYYIMFSVILILNTNIHSSFLCLSLFLALCLSLLIVIR